MQKVACPLSIACGLGHMNIVKLLLSRGADVNITCREVLASLWVLRLLVILVFYRMMVLSGSRS